MAKLKSEIEVACPCCDAVLVIDTNLRRVVSHRVPERGDKPELNDAARILEADRAAIGANKFDLEATDAAVDAFDGALVRIALWHAVQCDDLGSFQSQPRVFAFVAQDPAGRPRGAAQFA